MIPARLYALLAEDDPQHWREMTGVECAVADAALERVRVAAQVVFE